MKVVLAQDPYRPKDSRLVLPPVLDTPERITEFLERLSALQKLTPITVLDATSIVVRRMWEHAELYPRVTLVIQPYVLTDTECKKYTGTVPKALVKKVVRRDFPQWYSTNWYKRYYTGARRTVKKVLTQVKLYRAYVQGNFLLEYGTPRPNRL